MEKKFKIGDSVILKSGGPCMTVTGFRKTRPIKGEGQFNGRIECTWFKDTEVLHGDFPQDALELDE